MLVKVAKHNGYMCLLPPEAYNATVTKAFGGKYSVKWKCIVADWSSANCLKLDRLAHKYGWTIQADEKFRKAIGLMVPAWREELLARNLEKLA